MRITWVSHEVNLDGAERCLLEAARGLVARGHEVQVILPRRGDLESHLARIPVPVSIVRTSGWAGAGAWRSLPYRLRRLCRNLLGVKGLCRHLQRTRPDVVVSNTLTIPMGAVASRQVNIPHVWYIHEFGGKGYDLRFDFGDSLSRFLMERLSDRIIVNSRAVHQKFERWFSSDKLRLVYGAVEVPTEPARIADGGGAMKLILLGRLDPLKRQEDAIRAVSLLAGRGIEVHLTLMGREMPEYGPFLRQLIRELGVDRRVELLPFAESPFSNVVGSDVALMCSRGEGFGRVTVEAMKLGKPVIGANSGGTAELIRDGWNGFLYRTGDCEELARKIEALYHDRTLLMEMGAHAREWSTQTFNLERYTSGLLNLFDEVLMLRGKQGRASRRATSPGFESPPSDARDAGGRG